MVFRKNLSATEISNYESYLFTKWNVSPPAPTPTPTPSVSVTPSITPSVTVTPSTTITPSVTVTTTVTVTSSTTITPSVTVTPSISITPSITPSATPPSLCDITISGVGISGGGDNFDCYSNGVDVNGLNNGSGFSGAWTIVSSNV